MLNLSTKIERKLVSKVNTNFRIRSGTTCRCTAGSSGFKTKAPASQAGGCLIQTQNLEARLLAAGPHPLTEPEIRWGHAGSITNVAAGARSRPEQPQTSGTAIRGTDQLQVRDFRRADFTQLWTCTKIPGTCTRSIRSPRISGVTFPETETTAGCRHRRR